MNLVYLDDLHICSPRMEPGTWQVLSKYSLGGQGRDTGTEQISGIVAASLLGQMKP